MILKYTNENWDIQYADLGKNFILVTKVIEPAVIITFYRIEKGQYQTRMIEIMAEMNLGSEENNETILDDDIYFYDTIIPAAEGVAKDMIEEALTDGVTILDLEKLKERASAVMNALGKRYLKQVGKLESAE